MFIIHQMSDILCRENIPSIIQTHLKDYAQHQIQLSPLFGLINQTYKLSAPGKKSLVFRIFQGNFNRQNQNLIINELSASSISPKCLVINEKYRIQEYVQNAYHPKSLEIRNNQEILKLVLDKLCDLHQVKVPENFDRTIMADKIFTQQTKQFFLSVKWPVIEEIQQFNCFKNEIMAKFPLMKAIYEQNFRFKQTSINKIRFCHNDLHYLNIFLRQKEGSPDKECILIDYDYGAYNYLAYDIANTINETCYIYNDEKPGFSYTQPLNAAFIRKVCSMYRGSYDGIEFDIAVMLVLLNFFWAMKGLVSKGPDSNFHNMKHGQHRLEICEYYMQLMETMRSNESTESE